MYRSGPNEQLHTVANSADPTFTDAQIVPRVFLDEPDMALALSNKDNYRKLYKVNMKTMTLGAPVFERPGYDIEGGVITNFERNKLIGVSVEETADREYWFDPRLEADPAEHGRAASAPATPTSSRATARTSG